MKHPNGYGSVFKLSGNRRNPYCARKTSGWNDKGQPVYTVIGYYPTRNEALIALADYNKDPYDVGVNKISFKEVYERWSSEHFPKVSDSNVKGYKAAYKLCAPIEDMKLADIKIDHLQKIVDTSGKNTPTLKKLKILWGLMYDYAVIHEIVPHEKRAMVKYVDISQAGNPNAYNRSALTKAQVEKIWNVKYSNEYYSVLLMYIYTGCRVSELLELKKSDVHLEERWFYIGKAKTEAGIREVPIAEKIVPFFEHWLAKDCETLLCSNDSKPFEYRNFYDSYWMPLAEALNLPKFTPHCARHTCISMLAEAGVDERIIKKIVGHKGIGVTETVYTHLELPIKLEAINKI